MATRISLVKLGCAALLLAVALVLLIRGYDLSNTVNATLNLLRIAGPTTFFVAMALLPAVGAPLSLFCITAGSVFSPQLGMPVVILLSLSSIAANIALSYLLARRALRPLCEYVLGRLGYQLPLVGPGVVTDLVVLLRVTPGLPFPVQNYLLGLAAVPFLRYFLISCLIAFPLNASIIIFGEALLQGRGRTALFGLLLVLTAMVGIHLVRRRYSARDQAISR
ncbi:MAG TPA: hypothetical protein VNQ32_12135 [Steroidobacteraceae bacterium]|nr:hypothetical protein [Steroidobacteraceae bacterium]